MLLEKIQPLLGEFRAKARQTELSASVPREHVAKLQAAGFFKALQPKAYGGAESSISEYAESVVALAQGCASTAWACSLLANHSHGLGLFSKQAQDDVWGQDQSTLVSSSVAPLGKYEDTEGGIKLSGKFGWSSGCDHAQWAIVGYMGVNELGQAGPCYALIPRSDYQIIEDWDSAALSGTGSKTLSVENVFVPEHRCESLLGLNVQMSKGYGLHTGNLFKMPYSPIFSLGFSAVAIGIAQRMLTVYRDKTANRTRAYTGARVADSVPAVMRLAESDCQVTAALELLRHDWREMDTCVEQGLAPDPERVMQWRVHQSYSTKLAIEAVDRMFAAAGGSAWANSNEMQRLFRDVHICGSHAQTDFDVAAKTYGRHLMGLTADKQDY